MNYLEEEALHAERLRSIADQITLHLPGIWHRPDDQEAVWYVHIKRHDGLKLSIALDQSRHARLQVHAVMPQIPGPIQAGGETITLDPNRDPVAMAREIQRRVVIPWEPKLAQKLADNAQIMAKREASVRLYEAMLEYFGENYPRRIDEHKEALRQGNSASVSIGRAYNDPLSGSVLMSSGSSYVEFKLQVRGHDLAREVAEMLALMLAQPTEREVPAHCDAAVTPGQRTSY